MKNKLTCRLKELTVFILILTMIIPTVTLAADIAPPEILPDYFDHSKISNVYHSLEEAPLPPFVDEYEIDQALIDQTLYEQANYWLQDPHVQATLRFHELITSSTYFSYLNEDDRILVFDQLDIAEAAFDIATELFLMMEQDGLQLPQSVDIMVIISVGLFSYTEAKQLIENIPCMLERNTEIMRFLDFTRNFSMPDEVVSRNILNNPQNHPLEIANINSFFDTSWLTTPIFTSPASFKVRVAPPPDDFYVPFIDLENFDIQFTSLSDIDVRFTSPGGIVVQPPAPPEYTTDIAALFQAFTNENAFNIARQMFLDNHGVAEIEAAFALGAALQVEPETFLLPPDVYRTESAIMFGGDGDDSEIQAVSAFSAAFDDFVAVPTIPTPPRATQFMPQAMEQPFDVSQVLYAVDDDSYELDYLIEYGLGIMGMSTAGGLLVPFHDSVISNPFGLQFNSGDSVSLNTGAAIYRTNILSLPGRGGFGLNLDLLYNSANADARTIQKLVVPLRFCYHRNRIVELCPFNIPFECLFFCTFVEIGRRYDNILTEQKNPYGLGTGWTFDLPYIWNDVLYLPGRGSFVLTGNVIWDGQVVQNGNIISNHSLQDMRMHTDTSFVSGNRRSIQRLTFYDGTSYFFAPVYSSGDARRRVVIGKRDRYGNTIRFEYSGAQLTRIIDTNGNHINFARQRSGNNYTLTITSPDGSTFVINMIYCFVFGYQEIRSIQNQMGLITTFSYDFSTFFYSMDTKNPWTSNQAMLLTRVTYPSGAQLRFTYGWRNSNLGRLGSRHSFIATSRELVYSGRSYNQTTFSYTGDPTGFPQQVDRPPTNHSYGTTVTQNNGLRTVYTFNHQHLKNRQETRNAGNVLLAEQAITYNANRLPAVVTSTEHSGGFSRTNTQRFYYNRYGQVTTAVSPMAQGSTNARYRTVITYDNRFGLPLTTTFMPDANTTVRTVNRLSADGRNIAGTDIYENNVRMSRTNFVHDSFGNVTEIREFPNANTAEFIATQITFDRGTMPSSIRTTGVRDVNNALVGGTGIVERRFTYDNLWRVLTETDPMGYATRLEYDRLGRVTRITHPNGGQDVYTYNDRTNTLTHQTTLGATYTHQFDGFGNLLTVTCPNGIIILRNVYDNRMRLIRTYNAQGISSSGITHFTYDIFGRVTQAAVRRPGAASDSSRTTTQYFDVVDASGNRRVVTTVVGNSVNAPSIQTFVQYDRFGRRTQEGTVGGRIFTYDYDLAGRITRERSLGIDNNFTHNVFGITHVRNIEGNTSHSTFDSMGRTLTATDFMGNTQRFTYDALGRIIQHQVPFQRSGSTTHYSTTRYIYDHNSNLTRTSASINLPGAAAAWSHTDNTFRHNQLMSSQTGNGPVTEFTYDLAGNILTQRVGGVANAATTTFAYNNRGQLIRTTDALGQAETFTYDANGLQITSTDRNGTTFRRTHDELGRIVREEAVRNGVVTGLREYAFFFTGALSRSSNGSHVITHRYDAQGRLIRQDETDGVVKTFAYNGANNVTESRVYVNSGRQYRNIYAFDVAQRVRTVTAENELVSTYTYNANGARMRTTLSNGTVTDYTHNLAGLVTQVVNRHGNTILSQFDYIFYLDGNISQVIEQMPIPPRITTENLPNGVVGTAYSQSLDSEGIARPTWVISNGNLPTGLALDRNTGVISGTPTAPGTFRFTVTASDEEGSYSREFSIRIVEPPRIIATELQDGWIRSAYYGGITATGCGPFTWSVTSGTLPPGLGLRRLGSIYPISIYGRPTTVGTYTFTITATNEAGSSSQEFTLNIVYVPVTITTTSLPDGRIGVDYHYELESTGLDYPRWSSGNLPDWLFIDRWTGLLLGTPTAYGTFHFTIVVSGIEGGYARDFTIHIPGPPRITTTTLPGGLGGTEYHYALSAISDSPITWAVTGGRLPPGLTLDAITGRIRGTPAMSEGMFHFTITATNSEGSASQAFTINIAIPTPSSFATLELPDGTVGVHYSQQIRLVGPIMSRPDFSISSGSLPNGLFLGHSNGTISGIPTVSGTFTFTVTVWTDEGRNTREFTIIIAPGYKPPTILPNGMVGSDYWQSYPNWHSMGITQPRAYVSSGHLPDGLYLDFSRPLIHGTPTTPGVFSFSITIFSSFACGAYTHEFSIEILPNDSRGRAMQAFSAMHAFSDMTGFTTLMVASGNVLAERTTTFTYDTARRLIREHDTGAGGGATTRSYTFDNRGNRAKMTVTGAEVYTVDYTYDLSNRLLTEVRTGSNPSTRTFTYDANGNQLRQVTGNETETRTYNAFNQLTQVAVPGMTSTYMYRADGLRRSKVVNGVTTTHVWLRGHIVLERNASGGVVDRYLRGARGQLIRSERNGWYVFDARGSVVQRVNAQGQVLRSYRYTAFGSEINGAPGNENPFRFNGEFWDSHRGEYYLRARSFNPRTGRFTQPDPFFHALHGNLQSCVTQAGNLFMYVMHNPVMWTDPWGLFAELPSFILYDPNTHLFTVHWHVAHIANALSELFGGPVERIQTLGWTAEDFTEWWNSLSGDIGAIVFFGHSAWDRLQFDSGKDLGRGSASDFGITINQMQNLNTISLNMMLLMGCWTADMNRSNTISMAFARHINRGGTVFGTDGRGIDIPRIPFYGGRSRILDGSQYFIAHVYRDGVVNRHHAVHAPSYARPGAHVRLMHSWHVSHHWLTNPSRHLFQ